MAPADNREIAADLTSPVSTVDVRVVRTRKDVERAALGVLLTEGRDSVTQQRIAEAAGYSKATVYKHWPTRADLLRGTFERLGDVEHHTPTGNLRADLVSELVVFRRSMEHDGLDRALAILADLTASSPDLVDVRDKLVAAGERVIRTLLATMMSGARLETATLMLCGAILHSALMHGEFPSDEIIAIAVDFTLDQVGAVSNPEADR